MASNEKRARNDVRSAGILPSDMQRVAFSESRRSPSRSTSPSSAWTSSASSSNGVSDIQRDIIQSLAFVRESNVPQRTMSVVSESLSIDDCHEHECSKCKLTEEEAKRIRAERRKEQNRASQRRFRAKKENEIRGAADQVASLEFLVQDLQRQNLELGQANVTLMARVTELEFHRDSPAESNKQHSLPTAQCHSCRKVSSVDTAEVLDCIWPVECTDDQQHHGHHTQVDTYLPFYEHDVMLYAT